MFATLVALCGHCQDKELVAGHPRGLWRCLVLVLVLLVVAAQADHRDLLCHPGRHHCAVGPHAVASGRGGLHLEGHGCVRAVGQLEVVHGLSPLLGGGRPHLCSGVEAQRVRVYRQRHGAVVACVWDALQIQRSDVFANRKKHHHVDMSSSVKFGCLTLLHTACGAGILAMPFAFQPFGVWAGNVTLGWCALCAMLGLLLQAYVVKYSPQPHQSSFFVLASLINKDLSVLFDVAIAVKCLGVGISYMIVVGDLMPQICHIFTEHAWLLSRNLHITLIMSLIVTPLCFMKKLTSLKYASLIAISAVVYLCILVIFHFLIPNEQIQDLKGTVSWSLPHNDNSILTTLPIFIFAFTCHHNMFSIINEQVDTNFNVTKFIAFWSMLMAYALYFCIGNAGYFTFGSNITGNIIMLYPKTVSSTIGRIAIVCLVTLAFPLQCHPARASIHHIIHFILQKWTKNTHTTTISSSLTPNLTTEDDILLVDQLIEEDSNNQPQITPLSDKRFKLITVSILIFSYLVAISIHSLAFVLSIVGATGSTSIAFILPGIFGFKLIGKDYADSMPLHLRFFKYSGLALAIWGVLVMITSLFTTLFMGDTSH